MDAALKPVVFACSGCSPAGQLANQLALELDRRGIAEMSCLAGLGAEKPVFLKLAERRPVWIIDGCPIECGGGIAEKVERLPVLHLRLHDFGIKKKEGRPDHVSLEQLVEWVKQQAAQAPQWQPRSPQSSGAPR